MKGEAKNERIIEREELSRSGQEKECSIEMWMFPVELLNTVQLFFEKINSSDS